jgi:hypothetical protein
MKIKARNLHRDLGYLHWTDCIFAFSGLLMNHRDMWHPEKYYRKSHHSETPEENKIDEKFLRIWKKLESKTSSDVIM